MIPSRTSVPPGSLIQRRETEPSRPFSLHSSSKSGAVAFIHNKADRLQLVGVGIYKVSRFSNAGVAHERRSPDRAQCGALIRRYLVIDHEFVPKMRLARKVCH